MTRRVLVISYYFPPDGGPGTQRTAKFCKYFGEFGWHPIVLTRSAEKERGRWDPEDATLLGEIGSDAVVIRVPEPAGGTAKSRLDAWIEAAHAAARKAIDEHAPDVVLITMSPFELTDIGNRLRQETQVPVVYDLRDPWALDGWRLYGKKSQWKADYERMRNALSSASGVVANTPESERALLEHTPGLSSGRVTVVNNGYDSEDFDLDVEPLESDRLWLVHTGTLHTHTLYAYEGIKGKLKKMLHYRPEPILTSGRTPLHLLRAIKELRQQGHPLGDRLQVAFVGLSDPATKRCVDASGVADCVRIEGYQTHRESVAWLRRAHALFLPLHGSANGRRSLIVPGKVYEYLAAERPMLACVPQGDARDIVEESGHAFVSDPCDTDSIVTALIQLSEDIESNGVVRSLPSSLQRYERRQLTGKLVAFLDRIVSVETARAQ